MTRRERLERKVEKREEWAESAKQKAEQRFATAHTLAHVLPFGQPILVGHHSERAHRALIKRMSQNMDKGCELSDKAEHHEQKAEGLARQLDHSVFSDDSDAIEQLEKRISENEAKRDRMKLVNTLYKKNDAEGLGALGIDIHRLQSKLAEAGSYWGSKPHLSYEFTNLGARIRSDRERIEIIKKQAERTQKAEASDSGILIEGNEWVRVTFAEKPEREILTALKAAGFRWGGGAWTGRRADLPEEVAA